MTCLVCPNCGLDLEQYNRVERGNVVIEPHEVRWKGHPIPLSSSGRIIVSALVRADGLPVSHNGLAEALGCEAQDPNNVVAVQLCRVQRKFRTVDPEFGAIKNLRGVGWRWAA